MNKILLLSFLFSCVCFTYIHSQENEHYILDRFKERRKIKQAKRDSIDLVFQERLESNIIVKSGYNLSLSAKFQYGALGCAATSAIFFWSASKCNSYKDYSGHTHHSHGYYILNMFGGAAVAASVFCEAMAINYKLKSGKCLMLAPSPNGVTACVKF